MASYGTRRGRPARRAGQVGRVVAWAVVVVVATSAGAVGRATYDARNADKVDGRHAVGAGSSAGQRANKLVATDRAGRLPAGVMTTAPNSTALGGTPAAAWRTVTISPWQMFSNPDIPANSGGISLPSTAQNWVVYSFTVPRGHRPEAALSFTLTYVPSYFPEPCTWRFSTAALRARVGASPTEDAAWVESASKATAGDFQEPAGGLVATRTFTYDKAARPGDYLSLTIARPEAADKTGQCGSVRVVGAELRY